jgi:hypothetical protein
MQRRPGLPPDPVEPRVVAVARALLYGGAALCFVWAAGLLLDGDGQSWRLIGVAVLCFGAIGLALAVSVRRNP